MALAVLGFAAFEFTAEVTSHAASAAAKTPGSPPSITAVLPATPTARATASTASAARVSPTATATATATAAPQARTMAAISAVAFGPGGTGDGDNPQIAARVLTDPALGWTTQWYATPSFGDLKPGTGLLLDLGRTVTITTVELSLGSLPGAELQLRLGAAPDLAALSAVATATATGAQLNLPLTTPQRARYVLLWFTRLAPNGAGAYAALVHQVTVRGLS